MKYTFLLLTITTFYSCAGSNQPGAAIGAEKIAKYMQPGYKPKTKKEKAEYKMVMKQVKEDMQRAKKAPKSSSTY